MVEPLLGHQVLVAGCDPLARLATVRTRPAGPAGSAGLDLGSGVELDVDVAHPGSLAGLTVELPSTGEIGELPAAVRRRLDVLLGAERAAALHALVREGANHQAPLQRRLARDGRDVEGGDADAPGAGAAPRSQRAAREQVDAGMAPPLQRAALAHAAACEPGVPRFVRAVALIEAAGALDQLAYRLDLRATARHDARVGADLLLDLLADGLVAVPSDWVAGALASVVRQASRLLDGQPLAASRLVTLAGDLERGHCTTGSRPVPASGDLAPAQGPSPRHPVDADRHVRVDIRSLPGALAEAAVTGRRTGPDHVEVRVDGWVERRHGLWARAFDPADDTLLALGPLRRDGRDAAAHLLVPPWAIRRVEVDITDRPEMPRPSTALAAVERAIHLGGVAARAERVGHRRAAGRRWRQCARAWQAAGDATRAEQALTYARVGLADHRPAGRVIRPLVSDLIERYG